MFIDPVSVYLGGRADSHKDADVRALMAPAGKLASLHGVALILVMHLNKGGGSAMYRTMGSLAFVAAARAAYAVMKSPDDLGQRLVLPIKNNLGADNLGLSYTIAVAAQDMPYIEWGSSYTSITADEVLNPEKETHLSPAVEEACDFLLAALKDGPCTVEKLQQEAKGAGIAFRTVERAKSKLGVRSRKRAGMEHGPWEWHLTNSRTSNNTANVANNGAVTP